MHWVLLLTDKCTAVYFDSFGIEYIPKKVLNKIKDKSISHNIFWIQSDDCISGSLSELYISMMNLFQ